MPIMATSIRRIVQLLLITLLVNAGGWTFNGAAVADVFLQETQQNDAAAAQAGEPESCTTKAVCNHWCHAVGHFIGLFPPPLGIIPAVATGDRFAAKRLIILPLLPAGHFRPPRLLS